MDQMPVLRIQTLFESGMRHGADQPFGVLPPMQDGDANNLSKQYSHARAHNARAQFSLTDCQRELCSFFISGGETNDDVGRIGGAVFHRQCIHRTADCRADARASENKELSGADQPETTNKKAEIHVQ